MSRQTPDEFFAQVGALLGTEVPVAARKLDGDERWNDRQSIERRKEILRTGIRDRKSAIELADRILALGSQPGYVAYIEELERRRAIRLHELETSTATDSFLRVLQGRCQELGALLSLMRSGRENRQELAKALQAMEDELASYDKPETT